MAFGPMEWEDTSALNHSAAGSHLILSDLCFDTASEVVLTVGQFGEP